MDLAPVEPWTQEDARRPDHNDQGHDEEAHKAQGAHGCRTVRGGERVSEMVRPESWLARPKKGRREERASPWVLRETARVGSTGRPALANYHAGWRGCQGATALGISEGQAGRPAEKGHGSQTPFRAPSRVLKLSGRMTAQLMPVIVAARLVHQASPNAWSSSGRKLSPTMMRYAIQLRRGGSGVGWGGRQGGKPEGRMLAGHTPRLSNILITAERHALGDVTVQCMFVLDSCSLRRQQGRAPQDAVLAAPGPPAKAVREDDGRHE